MGDCGVALIIEDDSSIQTCLTMALEFENWRVLAANNGKVALNLLIEGFFPDLILLDMVMPCFDGLYFLRERRLVPYLRSIPVLVMTAQQDISSLDDFSGDIKGILRKPIPYDELIQCVNKFRKGAVSVGFSN